MGRPRHREAGPAAPVNQQWSQVSVRWNLHSQNLSLPWFPIRTPTHLTTLPDPAWGTSSLSQLVLSPALWMGTDLISFSVSPFQMKKLRQRELKPFAEALGSVLPLASFKGFTHSPGDPGRAPNTLPTLLGKPHSRAKGNEARDRLPGIPSLGKHPCQSGC